MGSASGSPKRPAGCCRGVPRSATEQIGLTKLYNAVDEGAWTDLSALYRELDEAVVAATAGPAPSPGTIASWCAG